jgi:hypothetical protein
MPDAAAPDPQLGEQAGELGAGNQSAVPTQIQVDPWPRQVALANASAEIYLPQVRIRGFGKLTLGTTLCREAANQHIADREAQQVERPQWPIKSLTSNMAKRPVSDE